MCASKTELKECLVCKKAGGILACDGCKQFFCLKHVVEHRQELNVQLDSIVKDQDLFRNELEQSTIKTHPLFKKIDKWENESITKIKIAADAARASLDEALKKSTENISRICSTLAENLRSARENDDFSEQDLDRWKKQLKDFKKEILSPLSAKLIFKKDNPIYPIDLQTNQPSEEKCLPQTNFQISDTQEKFVQTFGSVNLLDNDTVLKHIGSSINNIYVSGRFSYSKGVHMIRFKIENSKEPYQIFFGCTTSQTVLKEDLLRSITTVGWFGNNQVYEHGRCSSNCKKHLYYSNTIKTGDQLCLIIDCDKTIMKLFHERLKTISTVSIDPKLAPLPWKLIVSLYYPNDSIRILPTD